jgi:hypothetical protein
MRKRFDIEEWILQASMLASILPIEPQTLGGCADEYPGTQLDYRSRSKGAVLGLF